jgi:hypothetical protein
VFRLPGRLLAESVGYDAASARLSVA